MVAAERDPFGSREHCLCDIALEQNWIPGGSYGSYGTIRLFMETLLNVDPEGLTSIRWPAAAEFMVPAWAIRARPLTLWRVFLLLLNGTTPEPDANGVPMDVITQDTVLVYDRLAMLHLAHVFERLWFAVLDKN